MACISRTETSVIDKSDYSNEVFKYDKTKDILANDKNKTSHVVSPYTIMLPKNEPQYMAPLRRWEQQVGFLTPILWTNLIFISLLNIIAFAWFFYTWVFEHHKFNWKILLHTVITSCMCSFGITGGAHRYFSHRSFKAKTPLKVYLLTCFAMAAQNNVFQWVRDHRVHHKYSETSADPHDANRGFFFAHVGWLMMKKHPDVLAAGKKIDMTDIISDPLLRFYDRHFNAIKLLISFVIPIMIPRYLWNETWEMAVMSQLTRYAISLHCTWSVNSFAHLWGNKPYDRTIMPTENWLVALASFGEGWHNYHHTFPWDYKAAELPYSINLTTVWIDMFAALGWAYDRKVASQDLIDAVSKSRGDPLDASTRKQR